MSGLAFITFRHIEKFLKEVLFEDFEASFFPIDMNINSIELFMVIKNQLLLYMKEKFCLIIVLRFTLIISKQQTLQIKVKIVYLKI